MPNAGRSVIRLLAPVSVTTRFASAENSMVRTELLVFSPVVCLQFSLPGSSQLACS